MISCEPNTVLPFEEAIIETLRSKYQLEFDPDYLAHVAHFHGGVPLKPYFSFNSSVYRIGWMVALLGYDSSLPGPLQPATYYHEYDTRIEDRSLPSLIDHEIDPFFWGERLMPFAALYTHGKLPESLRLYSYDWNPDDSLCFDRSTTPQSIVYCNADRQVEEYIRNDEACDKLMQEGKEPDDEVRYDTFIEKVTDSFTAFCKMLRSAP
jgi:hypothetical protein